MKKTTIIFVTILLLVISIVYAEDLPMPCKFYGTVSINENPANSTDVTAYVEGTSDIVDIEYFDGVPFGQYGIKVSADGKNIFFKVKKLIVNEAAVACVGGSTSTELDLTATDADNDSYNFDDCNNDTADINPGATEICDGIDNDCNAATPDGSGESWFNQVTNCGTGFCARTGNFVCQSGVKTDTCVVGAPVTEKCGNDIDEDCDGADRACSGGGGGGGGKCKSEWNCTSWSECDNSIQTRTCSLQYPTCDPIEAKPAESQSCEMPVPEEIPAPAPNETLLNQTETPAEENLTGNVTPTGGRNLLTGLAIALFGGNANPIVGIIIVLLIAGLGVWLFFFLKRRKKKGKK
jgi:hypothetical protein